MNSGGFYTIGHSNRSVAEFAQMLQDAAVRLVVDVRSFPRSRSNPDYNQDDLPANLAPFGIDYLHLPDLGGRRPANDEIPEHLNGLWRNRSFHNYADYALGDAFGKALDALIAHGLQTRLAMMCSEAVWWRCHRRIIADHLLLRGHAVTHLMGAGRAQPATPTPGVRLSGHGEVIYPTAPGSSSPQ